MLSYDELSVLDPMWPDGSPTAGVAGDTKVAITDVYTRYYFVVTPISDIKFDVQKVRTTRQQWNEMYAQAVRRHEMLL